jgi:ATP-binding cassette subfamily B protein
MPYLEEEDFSGKLSSRTLLRMFSQARPYWHWVLAFAACIGIVALLDSYGTFLGKRIIDEGISRRDTSAVFQIAFLYGGIAIVQALTVFSFILIAGVLGERIQYDLRRRTFDHLQNLSLSYYDRTPVGWIMSRVTSDSERIAQLVTWGLVDTTWAAMNLVSALIFMFIINWRVALIVLAIVPVLLVVAGKFRTKIIIEYRKVRQINSRITGAYNESIAGVRVSKALCRERRNLEEFSELTDRMYRGGFRAAWLSALFLPAVQIISAMALGGIVWYGGRLALVGAMTVGGIQAFISYVTFMLWPIQDLARVYAELQNSVASAERIFSLLDTEPEITNNPGAVDPGSLRGEIRFENVDFAYEEDNPVYTGLNLTVKPGETIALVGPTGGGKSSLVNLVCRFYEPNSGGITIGGRDYRSFTLDGIHSRLGIVLQDPHLFSGSIRENIRYGRPGAGDDEVEQAARVARAHEFIVEMSDGYESDVGESGVLLSVGQKQLVSLARAVLADPDIFVMDEATSSIDTETERLIQLGMEALMTGRTSFVVAHRLSTIRRADRILVIEDGRITEEGTHRELIRNHGHYYSLYTRQFVDAALG